MTTMNYAFTPNPANSPKIQQAPQWLDRIGILNDYVRIPYANGSSFASQFLYRELDRRGHEVTVVGPEDPEAQPTELPPRHLLLRSVPLRNHPGVRLALPSPTGMRELASRRFDLILGQTSNALMQVGVWLRNTQRVPFLMVNTLHLPSVYNTLLPDFLDRSDSVHSLFREHIVPFAESQTVNAYNASDGLIVLSPGLRRYWRRLGVTVPIHVIPRAIETKIFDRPAGADPFDPAAPKGGRLLVVCRHVREKGIVRLLEIFAEHVASRNSNATLTLVGDGPDHDTFKAEAQRLGVAHRTFFAGELPQMEMVDYYAHADLFVYTSLSETYGQVVGEALWAGLPVVALQDDMGISGQVFDGHDGVLVKPGPDLTASNQAFGAAVVGLLNDPARRRVFSLEARIRARHRADPSQIVNRYYAAFQDAREHCHRAGANHSVLEEVGALARWAGVQSIAFGMGLLRPPVVVNRRKSQPPSWTLGSAA